METLNSKPAVLFMVLFIAWFTNFHPRLALSLKAGNKGHDINFHRNFTGVYFDPLGFIKGNALPIGLDEFGITALLKKVHTRFDTILLSLDVSEGRSVNLNYQLPEAAARLNAFLKVNQSSSSRRLKINILLTVTTWGIEKLFFNPFTDVQKVIVSANSIFPGTVNSVVLEMSGNLTDAACDNYIKFRNLFRNFAIIGIKVNLKDTIEAISSRYFAQKFKNDVLKDHSLGILYFTEDFVDVVKRPTVSEGLEILETQFSRCRNLLNWNNVTELALITTLEDTAENFTTKYAELVEFWEGVNEWAVKSKTPVILLQAFDCPFKDTMTNGWWRLQPNSSYLHPSQFVFEEKMSLIEGKAGSANLTWLGQPTKFSTNVVGVHFDLSPFALKSKSKSDLDVEEAGITQLIQQLSTKFSKVFVSIVHNVSEKYLNSSEETHISVPNAFAKWNLNSIRNAKMPMELLISFDDTTAAEVSKSAREANLLCEGTVSQLVFTPRPVPGYRYNNAHLLYGYLAIAKEVVGENSFSFGIELDLNMCNDHTRFPNFMGYIKEDFFNELEINTVYISALVSADITKLGSERLLGLLIVRFKNCRNSLEQILERDVNVVFMPGWPITGEESLEELVQFTSFWEGINAWADTTNTTVILVTAFAPPLSAVTAMQPRANDKYGWWVVTKRTSQEGTPRYKFEDRKEVALRYTTQQLDDDSDSYMLLIVTTTSVSAVTAIVIVALLTVFYLLKRRQSNGLTKEEIAQFFNGGDSSSSFGSPIQSMSGPYQKSGLELSKNSFEIDEASSLGSGEYGKICRGTVTEGGVVKEVAVKTTKVPPKAFALRGLMFEIKILSYLGSHPHIVGMVGAYTAELKKNRIFLFLELCGLGSLQSYLRKFKTPKTEASDVDEDQSDDNDDELTYLEAGQLHDMARWSCEIANGMNFLASKHIVHLDLATRNVLLTSDKRAKITDFGLSRRMYNQTYIKDNKHQEPLPWRSMAPEALKRSEFTEKSDVWALGVLLWEIYSLGDEPFAGLSWDVNFPTKLERGLRLGEPKHSQPGILTILLRCWNINPDKRPTFSGLVKDLDILLRAGRPTCSEKTPETPYPKTQPEIEKECLKTSSPSDVPQTVVNERRKIQSAFIWTWSSLTVILLLMVVGIIIWSSLKEAAVLGTSSNVVGMQPVPPADPGNQSRTEVKVNLQGARNISEKIRPLLEARKVKAINKDERYKKALGHKLFIAIVGDGNKEETVKALVFRGADVNVRLRKFHRTPLMVATHCSDDQYVSLRIIQFLIDNGADVNAKDMIDMTFLHRLVSHFDNGRTITPAQFHQITVYLISKNLTRLFSTQMRFPNNISNDFTTVTPVEVAIQTMEVENRTLMLLFENGYRLRNEGFEMLSSAVWAKRSVPLISFIIRMGANWRHVDSPRMSFLHLAAKVCYPEGVQYFIDKGLDKNGFNLLKETPLHLAVECKGGSLLGTVQVLLENGADPWIRNGYGNIPFNQAMARSDMADWFQVINLLSQNVTEADHSRNGLLDAIHAIGEVNTLNKFARYRKLLTKYENTTGSSMIY